jgi:CRISPR/Cas system CSM-associated protein Csm3 (group 7 of RAMP superfamily)
MELRQTRLDVILEATTPIAQAEGTDGNHSSHMARKIVQPDGTVVRVPTVTADAMRHKMREALTYALLDAAGMLEGKGPELTESALRLLFNGGMLTGRGSATAVKLTEFKDIMRKLPSLALFGGCANNHLVAGQLRVQDAQLVCAETWHLTPPWVQQWCKDHNRAPASFRAYLDEEMRVRDDPTRRRATQRLLSGEAADHTQRQLEASERAHDDDNAIAREATKSTMLPRTCEVIAPGALFYWSVIATTYDALEEDTFRTAVASFLAAGQVGGKGGTGHGYVRPLAGQLTELARPSATAETVDLAAVGQVGKIFKAHVTENRDAIRKVLAAVDA